MSLTKTAKFCKTHIHQPLEWVYCWNCGGDGVSSHDCGEDSCCCMEPEDNVLCHVCKGAGSYDVCPACMPDEEYEARYA